MGKMKAAAFAVAALLLATLCACAGQGSESSASHVGSGPVSSGASSMSSDSGAASSESSFAASSAAASAGPPDMPAYYVFESITIDDYTITDPNQLVMDGDGGHFENWYYLSIAIHDGTSGKLCTDGRIADFTYERVDDAITLDVPLDFGYDGTKLELGEGTLTMADDVGMTVLRQVDEAPVDALAAG